MKNYVFIVLIVFSICFSQKANSQYKSIFGQDSTSWTVHLTEIDREGIDSLTSKGDTVVNTISYKKLYKVGKNPIYGYLFGLIREDTVQGKIYTLNLSDTIENVIADFSMQVGDYLIFSDRRGGNDTAFVDSVFYVNGLKQISFNYQNWWQTKFKMIEGVGTTFGISYKLNDHVFFMVSLLCMQKDNFRLFQNCYTNGACCYNLLTGIADLNKTFSFKIYPNPAQQTISIKQNNLTTHDSVDIIIYDQIGRIIRQLKNPDLVSINISDINNGIYYIQLKTDKEIFKAEKFVIQR